MEGEEEGERKTDVEKCHGEVRRASGGEVCNLPHPPEHAPTRQVSTVKKSEGQIHGWRYRRWDTMYEKLRKLN